MSKLVEIRERLAGLYRDGAEIIKQYPDSDFPSEVEEAFKARNAEIADLTEQKKRLEENEALAKQYAEQNDFFNKPVGGIVHPTGDGENSKSGRGSGLVTAKSLGERFTESEEWKDFLAKAAPNGFISEKIRITSPQVQMGKIGLKTVVTGGSDTSGGAMVFNDVLSGIIGLPFRRLAIRDIITNGRTTSDTVEYVRVTGYTNAAATVAEATSSTAGDPGLKPESALAMEKVTAPVKTIAHWIPATKRALSDAAQLRTLIDAFLMEGLELELEDQIVNGNTVGEDFTGIANTANVQSQAFDTDLLTTYRKARTQVQVDANDIPTAYLMHPNDWQNVDLLQDNEGRYYFGGPRDMNQPRLWGLPVVESAVVPEGTAYVGNFKRCVVWDREQAGIQVSDSHSDFFIKNLVAILAEMRAAFGILRPESIVEIALS